MHLEPGAQLEVCVTPEGIVLRPVRDPDQWWYWTEEWQGGERELEAERAKGEQGPIFYPLEEFLEHLHSIGGNSHEPRQ